MGYRRRLLAVWGVLAVVASGCGGGDKPSTSTTPGRILSEGESRHPLTHDGLDRSYILLVPASVDWSRPVPLVFVFHGGTGNAESAVGSTGFNDVADANGFLVIYPNGTGPLEEDVFLTWNGGTCCGFANGKDVDDVGFVRAVVGDVQSMVDVDVSRVYATGMSNGGMLSHRLACEASDLFAAVAPVAGTLNFPGCNPAEPISVIMFHGTDDQTVPYSGGRGANSLVDTDFASVEDSVDSWLSSNNCNLQPREESFEDIRHESWSDCVGSTSVELYTVIGGGHSWPGGEKGWPWSDNPTQTIEASEMIWEFFDSHPKS